MKPGEYTFMRFTVEINMRGFAKDGGDVKARIVKAALLEAAQEFDPGAVVEETTE
jgi:hypothetical protein